MLHRHQVTVLLPTKVLVCLNARTGESDSRINQDTSVSNMYSS